MTSTDFITTTRGAVALTVAQLAAMANIGSNTDVFITIDANAAATTTQGTLQLTVLYTMA
jgi:N-acetylmuramoyl-L-alanine amidase